MSLLGGSCCGELLGEGTNRYFWFSALSVEKTCVLAADRRFTC